MISIVDYGLGNIQAFANVYKRLNVQCAVVRNATELENATKIILPGVGSFDEAMDLLNRSGMRDLLDELVMSRRVPVLGICVGMLVLARSSDGGEMPGIGWVEGVVKKFDAVAMAAVKNPLPHMGWNEVVPARPSALFGGVQFSVNLIEARRAG